MNKHIKYYKAGRTLLKDSDGQNVRNQRDLRQIREYYKAGRRLLDDPCFKYGQEQGQVESTKSPRRTEILNYLLSLSAGNTCYLEIGVRNPEDNYNHITADQKYSVDPGVEFKGNPVEFKMTSDEFF